MGPRPAAPRAQRQPSRGRRGGRAALRLVGTHDFAGFGRSPRPGGTTVRTVHEVSVRLVDAPEPFAGPAEPRGVVVIDVRADAFLYGMMRAFAGALVAVGTGRLEEDGLAQMIERPSGRGNRVAVAPAHGLHQWRVVYRTGPP
jgi:tRNA pseudouridine38-40 synthase